MAASLTASLDTSERILRVEGTDNADLIRIVQDGNVVSVDGAAIRVTDSDGNVAELGSVERALFDAVSVQALAGDDRIVIDDSARNGAPAIDAYIDGGDGNDEILGGQGNDILIGGAATVHDAAYDLDRDRAFYAVADEYLNWGGLDEKWLLGAAGWYFITPGGDVYLWDGAATASGELVGQIDPVYYEDPTLLVNACRADNDFVLGGSGTDLIFGGDGLDELVSDDDADADQVYGEGDNDALYGTVADILDGGEGENAIFTYDPEQGSGWGAAGPKVAVTLNSLTRTLLVEGTPFGDNVLVLHNGPRIGVYRVNADRSRTLIDNRTYDLDSFDTVVINGYEGRDKLVNDTSKFAQIRGGDDNDTIHGGHNRDDLYGENGDDLVYGAPNGLDGFESGLNTNDTLWGGAGNDTMYGGYGHDLLGGQDGNDELYGQWGNDWVIGSNWDFVNHVPNPVETGNANDKLFGDNGNDTLWGGNGHDTMSGGFDNDVMYGQDGNDRMWGAFPTSAAERPGSTNNDTMYGGNGNDDLYGGAGTDMLYGEAGLDGLFGGWNDGRDTLTGGANADRFLQTRFNIGLFVDEDAVTDQSVADAQVNFINGQKNWTDEDIIKSDVGLAWLHTYLGNTTMLELPDGSWLNFFRWSNIGTSLADNDQGTIRVADSAFGSGGIPIEDSIVHEIGHNWDDGIHAVFFGALSGWEVWNLTDSPTIKAGFRQADKFGSLQSWQGNDGKTYCWIYRTGTQFSRGDGYGRTNPREDFATCLETFYALTKPGSGANAASNWQAKWNYMRDWLNTMK